MVVVVLEVVVNGVVIGGVCILCRVLSCLGKYGGKMRLCRSLSFSRDRL